MVNLPTRIDAVAIGASVGAVSALSELLPLLPAQTPWPIFVVVHVPANQPSLLAELFRRSCSTPVAEARDKQPALPGVWFAPPDYHLLVESDGAMSLSVDAPVNHSRPSLDVLFESAADAYGKGLVCVVLTGASADGANGAKAVRDAGGFVVVQDPGTAENAIMPTHAIERAQPQWVASLAEIGHALREAALARTP